MTQHIRLMGQAAVMADGSILLLGGQVRLGCLTPLISLFINLFSMSWVVVTTSQDALDGPMSRQ